MQRRPQQASAPALKLAGRLACAPPLLMEHGAGGARRQRVEKIETRRRTVTRAHTARNTLWTRDLGGRTDLCGHCRRGHFARDCDLKLFAITQQTQHHCVRRQRVRPLPYKPGKQPSHAEGNATSRGTCPTRWGVVRALTLRAWGASDQRCDLFNRLPCHDARQRLQARFVQTERAACARVEACVQRTPWR